MRRVPWLALSAMIGAVGIGLSHFLQPLDRLIPDCPFKQLTGLACATCGSTRCLWALGRWDVREAFYWHPAMAVFLLLLPFLALWDLRRAWRGDSYPDLPQSRTARLSVWALLLAMWVLQLARGI